MARYLEGNTVHFPSLTNSRILSHAAEPKHQNRAPLDGPDYELDVIHIWLSAQDLDARFRNPELEAISPPAYPLLTW